jgi:histidinol-phosphate/aromatic aminotransferase/cobyric acid decarboxylase-like protein
MLELSKNEFLIAEKIKNLKNNSGTHSPSINTFTELIPEVKVKVDACFLSNPYATDLFMNYFHEELIDGGALRKYLEFYPSQNLVIAGILSKSLKVSEKNIFIGNGAIEVIQAVIHNFVQKKIIINIPTFSSYYEFCKKGVEIIYNKLDKGSDFKIDIDSYIKFVKNEKPDCVVIINPNNPDGGYIKRDDLLKIVTELNFVENIIIDESFVHFAFEDAELNKISTAEFFSSNKNLIIIKSMSKDFGIAGIRSGYGIMHEDRVRYLLSNGYLWNSNGLSEYFFNLYSRISFQSEYEILRKRYISETQSFFHDLKNVKNIKVYESRANFALVELLNNLSAKNLVIKLLLNDNIYLRNLDDKIGLDGEFVRIASRNKEENKYIIECLKRHLDD